MSYWTKLLVDLLPQIDMNVLNKRDEKGNTMLHYLYMKFYSSDHKYKNIIKLLLRRGYSLSYKEQTQIFKIKMGFLFSIQH